MKKKRRQSYILYCRDKVIAVSYPLKSSIWLTQKRAAHICYLTSCILLLANLSFIELAGVLPANNNQRYCGLNKRKYSLVVDVITASVLPIGRYWYTEEFISLHW